MQDIIEGHVYDTDTATLVRDISNGEPVGSFGYERSAIYRTPEGRFFVAGKGGPLSRWGVNYEVGPCRTGSEGIKAMSALDVEIAIEMYDTYGHGRELARRAAWLAWKPADPSYLPSSMRRARRNAAATQSAA
jgi:hypothetical protein